MGFVFFRDRTVIRKHIMLDCCRVARRLHRSKEQGRGYYLKNVRSFISLLGWFKHTDSYDCYQANVKPFISVRTCKKIISKEDIRRKANAGMETGGLLAEAA